MFVAFSAWLLRVLCVYTLYLATFVPARKTLPNCPLSAKKSISNDNLSIINLHMSKKSRTFARFFAQND